MIKIPLKFILILSLIPIFFIAPIDSDLGWHLRYGDYFLENGKFLKENILTYFLSGYYWPNSYSLYQAITTILYKIGNLQLLTLSYLLVMLFSFYLLNLTYPKTTKTNYLLFLLGAIASWQIFRLGPRAQIYSFLFFVLTNFCLSKMVEKENKKYFLILPLLFLVWANFHGGFVVGFALFLYYIIKSVADKKWGTAISISLIFLASLLATLINPYSIKIYAEIIRHITTPLRLLIAEWTPPPFYIKLTILISSICSILVLLLSKARNKIPNSMFLLVFMLSAIEAKRNVPFWSLFLTITILDSLQEKIKAIEKNRIMTKFVYITSLAVFIFPLFTSLPKNVSIIYDQDSFCRQGLLPYPCKAVEFIKKEKIDGKNVFSSYEWGGFLEWQLPGYKFFVDGRMPAWETKNKESPYTTYLKIIQAQEGWDKKLEEYETDWLLLPANTFLDLYLQEQNSNWKEIYRDKISAIYIKKE